MLNVSYASANRSPAWGLLCDQEIWNRFVTGDTEAFSYIYKNHSDDLFNYGMKIKPHRSLVKDCIHDLFVDLWRQRKNLSSTDSIKYYLFKALRRRMVYVIDREKKLFDDPGDEILNRDISMSIECSLVYHQSNEDVKKKIARGLSKLSARQREVIELIFFQQMSYEEVSEIMSINVRSVYTLTWKAVKAAKKHLSELL